MHLLDVPMMEPLRARCFAPLPIACVNALTTEKTVTAIGEDETWYLYSTFTWVGGDDVLFLPQ